MLSTYYKHKVIQDLAWVMESPVLLAPTSVQIINAQALDFPVKIWDDNYCLSLLHNSIQWLDALDRDPSPLEHYLARDQSHRLGHYFEQLVEYWIVHQIHPIFFQSHVQVQENSRTVGEFDFLYDSLNQGVITHLEVAVKFYLYYVDADRKPAFVGPNVNDRLDRKINHMFNQQLTLSSTVNGQSLICRLGYKQVQAALLLKGFLFYPASREKSKHIELPPYIAANHLRGWWTSSAALNIPRQNLHNRWLVLPKNQWLAPARRNPEELSQALTYTQLIEYCVAHFQHAGSALMVIELAPHSTLNWLEIDRGFIVPASWPEV